jgi:hypothetical protein
MPAMRYFLYVGAVLLALLFVVDANLRRTPIAETSDRDLPVPRIHIQSDQKWPERVVYDTSHPTPVPATVIVPAPAPTAGTTTEAEAEAPTGSTKNAAEPQVRAAFAQVKPSDTKKLEPRKQPERRTAKRHTPPKYFMAQRWQFDWHW